MKNLKPSRTRGAASFLAAIFSTLVFLNGGAAVITWTNTLGGNWSNPLNWSPNEVPGQLNALNSSDDVLITNAGTYTVVLDEGASPNFWDVRNLTLGGGGGAQTLAMTNKILYAALTVTNGGVLANNTSDFHAAITIANGGRLDSTNGNYFASPFMIASGGTFTTRGHIILESGGSLEIAGTLDVFNGVLTLDMPATNAGAMNVSSGAGLSIDNTLALFSPLTNSGALTVEGGYGEIAVSNNLSTAHGGLVNLSGGTINLNNARGISGGDDHEFFINQGTINSASGGQIQAIPGFTNSGAIYVTASTLNLDSGLHLQSSGSLNVQLNSASSYGKIAISGNAALTGAFNVTLGNGFNPQNGDSFQPVTYGSRSGNFTATNLPTLVPWQLSYGSSAVTLSVTTRTIIWINTAGGNWSDPNNWSPNIVPGGATYGNDDDAQITAPGTYTVVMDEGVVSSPYYLHSLTFGAGNGNGVQTLAVSNTWPDVASMSVNAGGQVDSSGNHWFNNWVTPLIIANGGVFNSTNDLFDQYVTVNSGGVFSADNSTNGNGWFNIAGALNVPAGNFVLNGATTNSGTITIGNGGGIFVNDNLVLSGAGGIVNLSGGAIDIAGNHGISGDNGAEYLSNQGQINSSGGYIQAVANFNNSGAINAVSGTLNLDSGLQLQSSGSLNSQLNGASDYGKIAIAGNAVLNGAFGVTLNYSPAAGDAFTPLTYDSHSGNFSSLNLPALGAGQSWQTTLGATALTLQIAETVTWTNTAGGNWSDPNNWNPNQVPGQFDDVGITAPGTYTVVMDPATVNIRSLTLGTGGGVNGTNTLSVVSKTFYVNPLTVTAGGILTNYESTFYANITVENGGQLNTDRGVYYVNPLTVADGGVLNVEEDTFHQSLVVGSGGLLESDGDAFVIAPDGSFTVNGTFNMTHNALALEGPMTNSGVINLVSQISILNNGTTLDGSLLNLPGGIINLNNSGIYNNITGGYGHEYFINQGAIILKDTGTASAGVSVANFDNSAGVVTNLSPGTLRLSSFSNTLAGIFYATNGSTIQFQGGTATTPLKPGVPLVLTGGGNFQFISGWLDLPTNTIPNLQQLVGGVLELEPTFQGGVITNLALDGITLTNTPGVVWAVTNGTFAVTNSAVYGDFNVENDAVLNGNNPTFHGALTVTDGGLLTATTATISSDGSLTVDDGGTINIPVNVLSLYGPMTNSGTISIYSNGGIYIYNNGTTNYQGYLLIYSAAQSILTASTEFKVPTAKADSTIKVRSSAREMEHKS